MTESNYHLIVRGDAARSRSAPREPMREHLRRIPGVSDEGEGRYRFGEADEHGCMEITLRGTSEDEATVPGGDPPAAPHDLCNAIEVSIPRPWVMPRGPQVFALVFMMAEWNGWEVYDPQIDDVLHKEAVLSGLVAVRQQQLESEGRGGPPGTQAHFVAPDPTAVSAERPARPSGVRMGRAAEPSEPYEPRTAPAAARKGTTARKPWWKVWDRE